VQVRVTGSFDINARRSIERALEQADAFKRPAVVIDLDTHAGSFVDAQLVVGSIIESSVPVYAYVNSAAWRAGALIALAADSTFMADGASMGWGDMSEDEAELPPAGLRELRSEFGVLAVRKGLDGQVAMAMVDPDVAIDGLVEAGERLTLSTADAIRLGFAAGQVDDVQQLCDALELEQPEVVTVIPQGLASGIRITVNNQNWRDVRISVLYGTSGSIRQNLGQVTSMNTAEFNIPQNLVVTGSRIQAIAQVVGSSEQTVTEQITVQSGLAIDWIIANMISQSNYFAYIRD